MAGHARRYACEIVLARLLEAISQLDGGSGRDGAFVSHANRVAGKLFRRNAPRRSGCRTRRKEPESGLYLAKMLSRLAGTLES